MGALAASLAVWRCCATQCEHRGLVALIPYEQGGFSVYWNMKTVYKLLEFNAFKTAANWILRSHDRWCTLFAKWVGFEDDHIILSSNGGPNEVAMHQSW